MGKLQGEIRGVAVFFAVSMVLGFSTCIKTPGRVLLQNNKRRPVTDTTRLGVNGFDIVIPFVLQHEGDIFVNDTNIREVSKRGITLAVYKEYFGRGDISSIKNISIDEATEIYRHLFWNKNNLDSIVKLGYLSTAIVLMDSEVNLGSYRANKYIQHVLGAKLTGKIDIQTINMLRESKITDSELSTMLINKRRVYYSRLIARRDVFKKYKNGWYNRLNDIYMLSKEISSES